MAKYIGTYGEKSLHRDLKWHFEPTGVFHEAPVGKYIADIKDDSGIIEIQTQSFNLLRVKLAALLPEHKVTLVYPIPQEKLLQWVDEEDGEIIRTRRSPKRGSYYHAFRELYKIKHLLKDTNLSLKLMLINVTERRSSNGSRKGYKKLETYVRSYCNELNLHNAADYQKLIPESLDGQFTSADYAAAAAVNKSNAGIAVNILYHMGAIARTGKTRNFYLYEKTEFLSN